MKWSMTDIATVVIGNAQLPNDDVIATAVAIAWAESRGDTDAIGDTHLQDGTWGPSIGLWQIRTLRNPGADRWRNIDNLRGNPQFQSLAMSAISNRGQNWRPWTAYNSGAYLLFKPAAAGAVRDARAGGAVDMSGADKGAAVGELIPGDRGQSLGDTIADIAGALGGIGAFVAKLNDEKFQRKIAKVVVGLALVVVGLLVLNRDLIESVADAAVSATPAGAVKEAIS